MYPLSVNLYFYVKNLVAYTEQQHHSHITAWTYFCQTSSLVWSTVLAWPGKKGDLTPLLYKRRFFVCLTRFGLNNLGHPTFAAFSISHYFSDGRSETKSFWTSVRLRILLTAGGCLILLQTWGSQILGPASFIIPLAVALSTFGAANGSCFSGCRSVMAVWV